VKCSWAKCSEGLSNRVSNIIRRYIDHMKFAACMAVSCITLFNVLSVPCFIFYFYHRIYGCMFCVRLFNFVNYVLLLLFMFCSVYSALLCCSVYCLCVNVYCTAATGCQPNYS